MGFHFTTVPSWWRATSQTTRLGIFYVGDTPSVGFAAGNTADTYTVRNYWGQVVSSGSFSGDTCTPTTPAGGWAPGWYRIYFTGPQSDAFYGTSYGATNFVVLRNDSRFPPNPTEAAVSVFDDAGEQAAKGILGIGTSRMEISTTADQYATVLPGILVSLARTKAYWSQPTHAPYVDAQRPARRPWINFVADAYDRLIVQGLSVYPKTGAVDGSQVFVQIDNGTTSGKKVTIRTPDAATIVETYDNQATATTAATAIRASSAYVTAFASAAWSGTTTTATAIGRAKRDGVIAVVQATYPDVQCFEGPSNEPTPSSEVAHQMRLFAEAVHAGNSSARAMGPCSVRVDGGWQDSFFAAGGGDWCDEIATHFYNTVDGQSLMQGRGVLDAWFARLAIYGQTGKPIWDTESNTVFVCSAGIYEPQQAAQVVFQSLLFEQYGIPRERTNHWYDNSHGFWSFPSWWINNDKSLNPQAVLYRVLAEETFGQTHTTRLTFGTLGDRFYLGSIYRAGGDVNAAGTLVLISSSENPGKTVTYTVTGSVSSLTVVDAMGVTSTVPVTAGRVSLGVGCQPLYVRLPAGVTVTPYRVHDWPPIALDARWVAASAPLGTLGGRYETILADGRPQVSRIAAKPGYVGSPVQVPDTATLIYGKPTRADRVIIFCPGVQQFNALTALTDFDVQVSSDGTTWTTVKTVNVDPGTVSFSHKTATIGTNCHREHYTRAQTVLDVKLDAPVSFTHLRLNVRGTTWGALPDAACVPFGGGTPTQTVYLAEVAAMCDAAAGVELVKA